MTKRRLLTALAAAPLAAVVAASLLVSRHAVRAVQEDLLLAEAGTAVALLRETGDAAAVERLVGARGRLTARVTEALDEPAMLDGRTAHAAVYDAEGWFAVGTLVVDSPDARTAAPPAGILVLALLALGLTGLAAWAWGSATSEPARLAVTAFAAVTILASLLTPVQWSLARLRAATDERIALSAAAVAALPDLEGALARPGAVPDVARLPLIVRRPSGDGVDFTALPTRATEQLAPAAAPAPARFGADDVTYAVADVGRVRITMVPYEHVHHPGPVVFTLAVVGFLLATLPVSLVPLASAPRRLRADVTAWSFLAPATLHLALFTLGPLAFAAWLSLHRWSPLDAARPFVGLANYLRVLADGEFWNAIGNTAFFTLHVPVAMAIALGLALAVERPGRMNVALRTVLFLPSVTSLVAIAIVWQWMLHDEYGLVNRALALVGVSPIQWLTSPTTALPSLMIMTVWIVIGFQMVIFQAGLAAIPQDLYDAARMDGAGRISRFVHVTLPGLRHTLFFVLVTSIIGSAQVFGAVYVMTEGGPLHATDVAVFHIYEEAWEFLRFGDAAAQSWVLFALLFVVTWLHFRTLERDPGQTA